MFCFLQETFCASNDKGVAEKALILKITRPIFERTYYVNYRRFTRDK